MRRLEDEALYGGAAGGGKSDALVAEALRQIEERDYTAVLRRYRFKEIRTYGIAFWDKECMVKEKKLK